MARTGRRVCYPHFPASSQIILSLVKLFHSVGVTAFVPQNKTPLQSADVLLNAYKQLLFLDKNKLEFLYVHIVFLLLAFHLFYRTNSAVS